MRKHLELSNPNSCMSRAGHDEITFVLLARDAAAPVAIRAWIAERLRLGKNEPADPQIVEAENCAAMMEVERDSSKLLFSPATDAEAADWEQRRRAEGPAPSETSAPAGVGVPGKTELLIRSAVQALKSYQYGNSSPDLAEEVAESLEKHLLELRSPPSASQVTGEARELAHGLTMEHDGMGGQWLECLCGMGGPSNLSDKNWENWICPDSLPSSRSGATETKGD